MGEVLDWTIVRAFLSRRKEYTGIKLSAGSIGLILTRSYGPQV